jgi:RNA-directed DNA polymerase
VSSGGKASVRQLELPLELAWDEAMAGTRGEDAPVAAQHLRERRREAENLRRARPQGSRHQGAPGVDGLTVEDRGASLKTHGPTRRAAGLAGR